MWLAVAAAAAFMLATAAPGVTLAAPPAQVGEATAIDNRFTPEEYADLSTYAKEEGLPLDEVLNRFAGLGEFYERLDEGRAKTGDNLVGAEWGFGAGTLYVHESALGAVRDVFASQSISVVESDSPNEAAQDRLATRVAAVLAANGSGVFEVHYDLHANVVEVSVPDVEADISPHSWAAASAVAAEYESTIKVVPLSAQSEPDARGGMAYSTCTGGFVVQSLGVYGISTAHHCTTKPSTYDGSNLGTTSASSTRDVRWARFTSGTPQPVFRYGWGSYRTATASSNPVVGAAVCKFGTTTGNTCDVVVSSGHCVTYTGFPEFCGLYRTDNRDADGGDSGGPWYFGSRAHGIHSGGSDAGNYDHFSGIGSLNLLSLTVVVG